MRLAGGLALLCLVLVTLSGRAWAVPDQEKIGLDVSTTETGAIATVIYTPRNLVLMVHRSTDSVTVHDLLTFEPVLNASGNPLVLDVVDDPVAIDIFVDNPANPTKALAFVAGFASNAVSVINLLTSPPSVLGAKEIDLTLSSDTANPGPATLIATAGQLLFVANAIEGTIQQFDFSGLPGGSISEVNFGTGSPDQTTAEGNLITCVVSQNTTQTSPRALLFYDARLWSGCINGVISNFDTSGNVVLRSDLGGGVNIESVRALAGDPRTGTKILYALDDTDNLVYAIDVSSGSFSNTSQDPTIDPVCRVSGADRNGIPLPTNVQSSAMLSFTDTTLNGGDFLAVLNTASTESNLQLIDLELIDTDSGTNPECGVGAANSISVPVTLSLGAPVFPASAVPSLIQQRIAQTGPYITIPNFSVTDGLDALTIVTDAPAFTDSGADTSAMTASTNPFGLAETMNSLTWDSDETIVGSPAPQAIVRIRGQRNTQPSLIHAASVGDTLMISFTSTDLLNSGLVSGTSNEILEIIAFGFDAQEDRGSEGQEIVFDNIVPMQPTSANVTPGDTILRVGPSGASDPAAGNGVRSGIGGYHVTFTAATDSMGNPVALPTDRVFRTTGAFTISGLQNDFTYDFEIRSFDQAGNVSSGALTASGTPVPGVGIIDLTGERGCGVGHSSGIAPALTFCGLLMLMIRRRRRLA